MNKRFKKISVCLSIIILYGIIQVGTAFAGEVDRLVVVENSQVINEAKLVFASAQSGAAVTPQNVLLAIERGSCPGTEYVSAEISATSNDSNVNATGGFLTLLPYWWTQPAGNLVSEYFTSNVTINVPKSSTIPDGTYAAQVTFTALGPDDFNDDGILEYSSTSITVYYTVDNTPPKLTMPADMTVDATSLAGAVVIFTNPTATDLVDGTDAVTCTPASGSIFPVGTTTVNCSTTDKAGNTSNGTFTVTVNPYVPPAPTDTTPPTTTAAPSGALGNNGWYTGDVQVTLSATENVGGSGVAATKYKVGTGPEQDYTVGNPITVTAEGSSTISFYSIDNAGNMEGTQSITITKDSIAPTIVAPESGGIYLLNSSVSWTASDNGSGLATLESGTIDTSSVGVNKSATITATDNAGNTSSRTINYTVITFSFQQPINPNGASVFKLGNTIPVKFKINAGNGITYLDGQTFKISVSSVGTNANVVANEMDVTSQTANMDNYFRYDTTSQQYIYNFSTKTNIFTSCISGGKYQINVYLGDNALTGNLIGTVQLGVSAK